MDKIKIFKPETYSEEIKNVRDDILKLPKSIQKEICRTGSVRDYVNSEIWNTNSAIKKLHSELISVLEKYEIVAYHNTRLTNPDIILQNGIIFSDDRYLESLRAGMLQHQIPQSLITSVISKVVSEINRHERNGNNPRKNEVCFIFDLDYYTDYPKFLATYGGEFLEYALTGSDNLVNKKEYKKVLALGKPYIVEFVIPFFKLDNQQQSDIACYMLEEWIHIDMRKDEPDHRYGGRVELEIPPENIVKIRSVNNDFQDFINGFFEEN